MEPPSHVVPLAADTFDAALAADGPLLVEFSAPWCSACRAVAPTVEAVAAEYEGHVVVATVDVDAHPGLADRFGVRSTFVLFDGGAPVDGVIGAVPRSSLVGRLDARLRLQGGARADSGQV